MATIANSKSFVPLIASTLLFSILVLLQKPSACEIIESTFLGGAGDDGIGVELPIDVAVGIDGNIIIAATTTSTDFEALSGYHSWGPGGGSDVIVATLDPELSQVLAVAIIGGSDEESGVALAISSTGQVCVVTNTFSADYPTTAGAYSRVRSAGTDFAVSVLSSDLTDLEASSYFGGPGYETQPDIAVDQNDQIFLSGLVASSEFPTTTGAYSRSLSGGADFFISKLSNDLSVLLASTYLGGSFAEGFPTIAINGLGEVVISGRSESDDYPVTSGAYDESFSGPPAPGQDLQDMVVSKLSGDLTALLASTFAGGPMYDGALFTAVDPDGNIVVTGHSASPDYPVTAGCYDVVHNGVNEMFISKFNPDLSVLIASTFMTPLDLGMGDATFGTGLSCDDNGNILYTGVAWGTEMPTTDNAYDSEFNGGMTDGMAFLFTPDLSRLIYASYLGGSGSDLYVVGCAQADGSLILAGNTESSDFPTTSGAYDESYSGGSTDLFISKFDYNCVTGCCGIYTGGITGNANCSEDGKVTLSDITQLIDRVYISKTELCCEKNGNTNGDVDGLITLGDITRLIDYVYISREETAACE